MRETFPRHRCGLLQVLNTVSDVQPVENLFAVLLSCYLNIAGVLAVPRSSLSRAMTNACHWQP